MPDFTCADAGAACKARFSAPSMDELLRKVATHLTDKHKVATPTQTIMNLVAKQSR